jgi:polyhomeotic-like protein 3
MITDTIHFNTYFKQIVSECLLEIISFHSLSLLKVSRSSLLIEQPVKKRPLLDNPVINSVCSQPELQNNTKHADNSSDTEMEDMIAEGLWISLIIPFNFGFYC